MHYLITFVVIFLSFGQAYAAVESCEKLKAEITAKIDATGARSYILIIEQSDETNEGDREDGGKIVGSCEGGTKKIVYIKEGA